MDVDLPADAPVKAESQETKPKDIPDPIPLMRSSVIIAIVMLLKSHLKTLYSISEECVPLILWLRQYSQLFNRKCIKFVIGKKSAVGDKPAVKKHDNPISWDRLPYAVTPIHTTYDAQKQKATVSAPLRRYCRVADTLHSSLRFGMRMVSVLSPKTKNCCFHHEFSTFH